MSRAAMTEEFPCRELPRPAGGDLVSRLIADAYQAERERFDPEIERTDADVFACRLDLLRAARTPQMRALLDRLAEAEEAAAEARRRGFFAAGIEAGIRIGGLGPGDRPEIRNPMLTAG